MEDLCQICLEDPRRMGKQPKPSLMNCEMDGSGIQGLTSLINEQYVCRGSEDRQLDSTSLLVKHKRPRPLAA